MALLLSWCACNERAWNKLDKFWMQRGSGQWVHLERLGLETIAYLGVRQDK
jgi:hypothetical protein